MSNPYDMERAFITERMEDKEITALDDAVECYLNDAVPDSDVIIATEIRKKFWRDIWEYREALEDYYSQEDDDDAEQDS